MNFVRFGFALFFCVIVQTRFCNGDQSAPSKNQQIHEILELYRSVHEKYDLQMKYLHELMIEILKILSKRTRFEVKVYSIPTEKHHEIDECRKEEHHENDDYTSTTQNPELIEEENKENTTQNPESVDEENKETTTQNPESVDEENKETTTQNPELIDEETTTPENLDESSTTLDNSTEEPTTTYTESKKLDEECTECCNGDTSMVGAMNNKLNLVGVYLVELGRYLINDNSKPSVPLERDGSVISNQDNENS